MPADMMSTSASLAVALWAIVVLGSLSPSSTPREGPMVTSQLDHPKSSYVPKRVTPQEVKSRINQGEKFLLVDVRAPESYEREHIDGAISSPWRDLAKGFAQLPKDRLMLLYCT